MTLRREVLTAALPALALAATSAQASTSCSKGARGISREHYDKYISLYNAGDPNFAQFYHPDVVMETVPPLRGADMIVNFTRDERTYITEQITVEYYVSDETGSAAQFLGEFRCIRDMPVTAFNGLFGKSVKQGQVLRQRGVILYGVKDGKFKFIRASPPIILQNWT